ncbi:sugar kinase [Aquimarina sp. RZ0]|uniref:sugar kinase n=1 Tax=Aquimarina sp. RZ0 TaxID=2607730 RepID=UPI0011F2C3E8|nr:sugar kinase [Aquimarina sp. RZ0]KAA1247863.1 sugar kinase [Aquimarina sp. RZ0]
MSFVTFGEIMLRLTPALHGEKLRTTEQFNVNFAGSESNVASSLAVLENDVSFITKLPDHAIGDHAIQSLNSYGIYTKNIIRGSGRIGTYFIEIGASIRPSSVIYDRSGSVFSQIGTSEFDWDLIFRDKKYLFISGITAALSDQCAAELIKCVETAKKHNILIGFDMNYRRKLWKDAQQARIIFDKILPMTDILFGNSGVLDDVYGIKPKTQHLLEATLESINIAKKHFGIEQYAFTIRNHLSASKNELQGVFYTENNSSISKKYTVDILDRFGTGDAFAAGCLHGIGKRWTPQQLIEFGTAAFALKHTIYGDQHTSTLSEINAIADGHTSGHVLR